MPVEIIVKYYNEIGIDMPKATAHSLIVKAGEILGTLNPIIKQVILSDHYIHFDETCHTVLDKNKENGSFKAYFWATLANGSKLKHFFYADGSRAKSVTGGGISINRIS